MRRIDVSIFQQRRKLKGSHRTIYKSGTGATANQSRSTLKPYERTEKPGNAQRIQGKRANCQSWDLDVKSASDKEWYFHYRLFERYQRSKHTLIATLMEVVVNGVSTRKVAMITEELCGTHALHRPYLELCKDLDVSLRAWKERDLSKTLYPFLILDGIVIKVREDGKVRPFSLLVATGIN
ncbi:MAG: putative transposase [Clostridiales bacterium]|nr:putative transposase [Clostridiales bacterium]